MSVINQMLKDLDKRQQTNPQSMAPLVEESGRSARAYILMGLVLIALMISAWLALRYFTNLELKSDVEVVTEATNNSSLSISPETEQLQAVAAAIDVELNEPSSSVELIAEPADTLSINDLPPKTTTELESVATPEPKSDVEQTLPTPTVEAEPEKIATSNDVVATDKVVEARVESEPEANKPLETVGRQTPLSKNVESNESSLEIKPLKLNREQQVALYTRRGFQALDKNQLVEARLEFNKALQLDHQAHEVREQLAALEFGRGNESAAVSLLEEGVQLSPLRGSFRVMLARIFVQQENLPQAIYYLESAEPEVSGNVDYYAMLAGLAQNLNKQELALSAYQKLVKHEPSRARWWMGYAIANDKLTHYNEALAAYRQAELMGQLSSHSRDFVANRIRQLEQ
ncbi:MULTISPECIES: tetratricopeptide repeat protein [unclassified Agarivorans]|uniref:tetratricopeptide repeat protein n=1 Tax=unclassified Agarivorans TaxID=2636026 RepID=UPI0026E37E7B|nr:MULTISPECIES: hypothetical protein [unclassified Agarivorans]MDO6686845.1 hypothetical protein [Agarivorans sp. 3_MG-2023]MDO6716642.1 hypothetical protein [Agarivorans sp. 2_MG-2023]